MAARTWHAREGKSANFFERPLPAARRELCHVLPDSNFWVTWSGGESSLSRPETGSSRMPNRAGSLPTLDRNRSVALRSGRARLRGEAWCIAQNQGSNRATQPSFAGWGHYHKRAHVRTLLNNLDNWIERRIWSRRYGCWFNCGWKRLPKQGRILARCGRGWRADEQRQSVVLACRSIWRVGGRRCECTERANICRLPRNSRQSRSGWSRDCTPMVPRGSESSRTRLPPSGAAR